MFILYALVIGLAVGLLLGGRLDRLGNVHLRWPWLALAGLIVQVILFAPSVGERFGPVAPAIYVGSTAAVFVFVLRNLSLPGFVLIALGAASNLLAIIANGGYMPASREALQALGWHAAKGYSNSREIADPAFWPLTDIFALPPWLPLANIFSVGDVLVALGVAVAVVSVVRSPTVPRWDVLGGLGALRRSGLRPRGASRKLDRMAQDQWPIGTGGPRN